MQKFTIIRTDKDGKISVTVHEREDDRPLVETYADTLAWALDFILAFNTYTNPITRWIIFKLIGKYSFRELVGLRDSINRYGYSTNDYGYDLEDLDYHNEKVKWL